MLIFNITVNTQDSLFFQCCRMSGSENSLIATLPCRHPFKLNTSPFKNIPLSTNPITDKKRHLNHEKNRDVLLCHQLSPSPLNIYSQEQVCSHRVAVSNNTEIKHTSWVKTTAFRRTDEIREISGLLCISNISVSHLRSAETIKIRKYYCNYISYWNYFLQLRKYCIYKPKPFTDVVWTLTQHALTHTLWVQMLWHHSHKSIFFQYQMKTD